MGRPDRHDRSRIRWFEWALIVVVTVAVVVGGALVFWFPAYLFFGP